MESEENGEKFPNVSRYKRSAAGIMWRNSSGVNLALPDYIGSPTTEGGEVSEQKERRKKSRSWWLCAPGAALSSGFLS